jgi:hypothetical protein
MAEYKITNKKEVVLDRSTMERLSSGPFGKPLL